MHSAVVAAVVKPTQDPPLQSRVRVHEHLRRNQGMCLVWRVTARLCWRVIARLCWLGRRGGENGASQGGGCNSAGLTPVRVHPPTCPAPSGLNVQSCSSTSSAWKTPLGAAHDGRSAQLSARCAMEHLYSIRWWLWRRWRKRRPVSRRKTSTAIRLLLPAPAKAAATHSVSLCAPPICLFRPSTFSRGHERHLLQGTRRKGRLLGATDGVRSRCSRSRRHPAISNRSEAPPVLAGSARLIRRGGVPTALPMEPQSPLRQDVSFPPSRCARTQPPTEPLFGVSTPPGWSRRTCRGVRGADQPRIPLRTGMVWTGDHLGHCRTY